MTVQVTGIKELRRSLAQVKAFIKSGSKPIMLKTGELIIKIIVTRTGKGKDANGKSFKSYSTAYKKTKAGSWLYVSGSMLSNLLKTATGKNVRVYVSVRRHWDNPEITNHRLAEIHNNGEGDQEEREFMGLTNQEVDQIVKFMEKEVRKEFKRLMR